MNQKKSNAMSCVLSGPELQKRKAGLLAELKTQVLEKKELGDGFAYRFEGSDRVLDQLNAFIKSERACCPFFTFVLNLRGDKKETWLELTGPEGAKDFIITELGL